MILSRPLHMENYLHNNSKKKNKKFVKFNESQCYIYYLLNFLKELISKASAVNEEYLIFNFLE